MSNLPPLLLVPTPLPTAAPGDEEEAVVPPPKRESGSIVLLKDLPEELRTLLLQPIISEKLGYDLRTTTRLRVSDLCEILSEFCAKSTREGGWVGLHDMCRSPNNDVWRQACSYFGVKGKFFKPWQRKEDMTWREMFFKLCRMFHWKARENSAYFLEQMRLLRTMLLALNRDMLPGEQPPTLEGYEQPPDVSDPDWEEMVQNCADLVEKLAELVKVRLGLRMLFINALSFLSRYESMPGLDQSQKEWVDEMMSYIDQMQTQSGYPELTRDEIARNPLIYKWHNEIKDHLKGLKLAPHFGPTLLPDDYRENHLIKIVRFSIVAGVDLTFLGTMVSGMYVGYSQVAECLNLLLDMGMTLKFLAAEPTDIDPRFPARENPRFFNLKSWIKWNYRENNGIMELIVRLFQNVKGSPSRFSYAHVLPYFDFDYVELMRILYAIKFVVQKIEKNEVFLEDTWQRNERRDPEESKNALKKLKALIEVLNPFGPSVVDSFHELYAETKKMIEDVLASFELEIKMATQESGEAGPSGVDHSKDGEEENG